MSKVTVTAIELSETEESVSGLLGLAVMRVVEGLTGEQSGKGGKPSDE